MKQYRIEGMTCEGCVRSVTRVLTKAGFEAQVDLSTHTATVQGDPDDSVVMAAVERAGFSASPAR